MPYNWETASKVLSEVEKNRIVCVYLNATIENSQIEWEKASKEFGSASVGAFKKGVSNTLKKLENEQGKENGGTSPVKESPTKKGGKKRKAAAGSDENGEEDGEAKPNPKKRGRKPKAEAAAATTEDEVEESVDVKEEEE